MQKNIYLLFFLSFIFLSFVSQGQKKRPLTIDDFQYWNILNNQVISNDGTIIAFEQNPQRGDGRLIVWKERGGYDTIPRGYNPVIGSESDFLLFSIRQHEDSIRKAKLAKVKKEDMPLDSLGILILRSNEVLKFAGLKSVKVPEENARWIAFIIKSGKQKEDSLQNLKSGKKEMQETGDLILFDVTTHDTLFINDVSEVYCSPDGSYIYYAKLVKDSLMTSSSLYVFDTNYNRQDILYSDKGWIKKVVSAKKGEKYAFLFSGDTADARVYSLYYGTLGTLPRKVVDGYTSGIPVGWSPCINSELIFSENSSKLYFGTAKDPEPDRKDTIPDDEKLRVDIWNWQDSKLQPQQLAELEKERKRTYMAVYHTDLDRFIQLADLDVKNINTINKGDGDIGLGYYEQPYLRESSWTGNTNRDYYIVDMVSGIKKEILKEKSNVVISPQGKYVVWYENSDSSYYALSTDLENAKPVPLTKMIPVNFYDEENDRPMDPQPYGIAGWSEGDRFIYIYDRYDIWKTDPSGDRVPVCITQAYGRRNNLRLRYVKLDPELEFIPSTQPLILSAFDENSMQAGFYNTRFDVVADPTKMIMDNYYFGNLKKAKNSTKIIYTKESVSQFPDLHLSDINFINSEKISDANPVQCDFIWPIVKMVEWISISGEKLKGLLYLPENIDTTSKYPLLVYYYEKNSEYLFRHQHPAPSRSVINKTFYTSNGYLVFVPDIVYKTGYPGHSAYEAVISGTQYLLNTYSFIDKNNMGLQGQSWGGYQTAYIITRTPIFSAAMAGAPVSNMTSAYGGIRWETGMSRMFQYEHQQSRIGGSLWEKPIHYLENSPLFYAPNINTPLLMMHNDNDGAVPWYQGIELFVALRRLDKPVWLLNYNGEPHNLKQSSWANRVDLSRRMFQFFNHYLKDQPMPVWMEKGVPAVNKGKETGY